MARNASATDRRSTCLVSGFDAVGAPSAADTYRDRLGAQSLGVDVSNTFVVKPEIGYWYDLNSKMALHLSAGFMVARPRLTVTNSLGSTSERLRADIFMFKVGAVYKVF